MHCALSAFPNRANWLVPVENQKKGLSKPRRFLLLVFSLTNPYDNVMSSPVSPPDLSGLSISSQLERNTHESYDSHPNAPAFFSTAPPGGAPYGNNVGHGQQSQASATYDAAHFNNTIASTGSKVRGGLPSVCNSNRLCSYFTDA